MIEGTVSEQGIPIIDLSVAGSRWTAIIDTGFNGDLELPMSLQTSLTGRFVGRVTSLLAAGQAIEEDLFLVEFPFDETTLQSEATFVAGSEILIGTHLLKNHRLTIDFVRKSVIIERE